MRFDSLAALYDVGRGAIRDTNGDGFADTVAACIILPSAASAQDVVAATNIAARLGYETMAMTLPVVVTDTEVTQPSTIALPILVGRLNTFIENLVRTGAVCLTGLAPGQGVVALVTSPCGGADGVVIAGKDDEGTLSAANVVAARLPRLWAMSGITLTALEEQALRYLTEKGVRATAASIPTLVVDSDSRGIAAVKLVVHVTASDGARAMAALHELKRARRRGLEPRTLSSANVARIDLSILSDTVPVGEVTLRRQGLTRETLNPPIAADELDTGASDERSQRSASEGAASARHFDLSTVYSIDGLFGDAYADLIPDRTDTVIVIGEPRESLGAAHVSARIGLESTGLTLPIAKSDAHVRDPSREPTPILIGRRNHLVDTLIRAGRADLRDLELGDGAVQVVPQAFGNATAIVVAGVDDTGTDAASGYLARRVPHVWETARGAPEFSDVLRDVSRFLRARSAVGQASRALAELDHALEAVAGNPLQTFEVKTWLDAADPALQTFLANRVRQRLKDISPVVSVVTATAPVPVIDEEIELTWEVDEFWAQLRTCVLPALPPGAHVVLEGRLSESPETRRAIAERARVELGEAGASTTEIRILSAYKQGFMWLIEEVLPELTGKNVASVNVRVAAYEPDLSAPFKFHQLPSRWLHELYPVDEVFERDLGLPKESFGLELVDDQDDTYVVEATNASGEVILRRTFSPKSVEREYLDRFPGWSRIHVSTGWISAAVNGRQVVDTRIATDPERFWDHYQANVLPRIHDHVMAVTGGQPLPEKQPFHRELRIDIWMSEPDFRIGIDEELVSSLESLHEDLYFVTLDFFDALGRTMVRRRLAAPGKIVPVIHPPRSGRGGHARILLTDNAVRGPRIEITYQETGTSHPVTVTRELKALETTAPRLMRCIVRADRVKELEVQVDAIDDREAVRICDALEAVTALHDAGLFQTSLSYAHVDRLTVSTVRNEVRSRRIVRHTGHTAPSHVRSAGAEPRLPVVTFDHVIGPCECEQTIARLGAYPEVKAYRAGQSYEGRDISVMEICLPSDAELVSRAKATTCKPTVLITGRQHANEVSSTSHILKLAELLVTDRTCRELLKRVNVILHPIENPDGAQLAFELQQLTPTHMLHAGRYTALGIDLVWQIDDPDPLLPEALVRGRLWRAWLPDAYLDPHGYPSHEWVRQFAGYLPPGFQSHAYPCGWYTTVRGLRDPRYPSHALVVDAIREEIVRAINSHPDVREMNQRHYARYRKWAYGFAPHTFSQEIYKETAIFYSDPESGQPIGRRLATFATADQRSRMSLAAYPNVTYFTGITEAPDETARGDWLSVVANAGLSYSMAVIQYLHDGRHQLTRIEEDGPGQTVRHTTLRPRPVLPRCVAKVR